MTRPRYEKPKFHLFYRKTRISKGSMIFQCKEHVLKVGELKNSWCIKDFMNLN